MKANPYISIKENRFLIIFASIIFAFTLINLGSIVIEDFNNSVKDKQEELRREADGNKFGNGIDFSICGFPRINFVPHFRFLSILVVIFLIFEKTILYASLCSFLSFCAFSYENYSRFNYYFENQIDLTFLETLNQIARPLDYVVFLLISILLFWQISILLRMLIKSLQRKTELP